MTRLLPLALWLVATTAEATPPYIPVQGVLYDDQGAVIDGQLEVVLTLYADAAKTTAFWTETRDVEFVAGSFTVYLGGATDLPLAAFQQYDEAWLGIAVDGDPEMDAIRVATVPYAAHAQTASEAQTLGGFAADDFLTNSYAPSWTEVANRPTVLDGGLAFGAGLAFASGTLSVDDLWLSSEVEALCYDDVAELTAVLDGVYQFTTSEGLTLGEDRVLSLDPAWLQAEVEAAAYHSVAELTTDLDDLYGFTVGDGLLFDVDRELSVDPDWLDGQLADRDTAAAALATSLATTQADLTAALSRITAAEGGLSAQSDRLDAAEADLADQDAALAALSGDFSDLETDLGTLQGDVSGLESDVGGLTAALGVTNGNVTNLTTALGVTNGNVTNLTTALGVTNGNVTNLTTALGVTNGNVTTLQADMVDAETNIGTLNSSLAFTNGNLTTLQGVVNGQATSISGLGADLADQASDISDLETDLTAVETSVGTLGTDLTALAAKVDLMPQVGSYSHRVKVQSRGLSDTSAWSGGGFVAVDGVTVSTTGRSYGLTVIDRTTGVATFNGTYDVYGDGVATATNLATALNAIGSDKIVIVNTYDEPAGSRTLGGLSDAMRRCGASGQFSAGFPLQDGTTGFTYRSAYLLVGVCGMGPGTGIEKYSGDIDSDTSAWVEASFVITDGDIVQ